MLTLTKAMLFGCAVFGCATGSDTEPMYLKSGSDLDGDEYAVLWLPDLIFFNPNKEAAHFPSVKSADVRNITETDMIYCLQEYIKKDQIGSMSHAHLALADKLGVEHPLCLSVAKKISIAVDFAKTGKVQPLERNERPTEFPDFMEKIFKPQYKSEKALGKMYRICRDYETENEEATFMHQSIKVDPDLMYPGWEEYEEVAKTMRNKYNSILGSLLRNYGFENESQVISGAFSKLHCRFQERKDMMEVQTIILLCVKKLKKSMLEEFLEEFTKAGDMSAIQNSLFRKASAWYMVTYSDPEAKFLSFPWIVSSYLAKIKILKTLGRNPPFSPAIMKFDEKIIECESGNLLPDCPEIDAWRSYDVLCELQILKRALCVLIMWAQDEEIVGKPYHHEGFLYMDTFIKLFLHVAQLRKYVAKRGVKAKSRGPYSPGKLCVEFLKFCSSLRFYNKNDIHQVLPFSVYKYSKLAKRAVVSYHRFALTGIFRNLYFDAKIKEDLLDMKPFPIDSKIFSDSLISDVDLRKAEQALVKYSGVNEVHLNEYRQTKKVFVSAIGSELALKELKAILRKKHAVLRQLFRAGAMVETVGVSRSSGIKRKYAEFSGEND